MPVHYELSPRPGADHVALITIDRPETRNACDLEHFHQLAQAWKRFGDDDAAWVAIITGVGRAFMSGADLKTYVPEITALAEKIAAGEADSVGGYSLSDGTDAVLRGTRIYKPIVAAINGPCVAGGMEMLGGIDIRIASEHATFGVLEPARGLFAGGGTTVRLPRQIAFAQAMEFLLCADQVDASRALAMGLVNAVVAEADLLDEAFRFAARITKNAPLAVQATKRSVLEGLKLDLREAFRNEAKIAQEIFTTEDAKEGPRAFTEKRAPQWQGVEPVNVAQPAVLHPAAHAAGTPDKTALIMAGTGESRSYAELDRRSVRVASLLQARGLVAGDGIAVLLPNQAAWFDIVWGALRCGLYVTPINWHLTPREAAYIVADCGAGAVFAAASLAATVDALEGAIGAIGLRFAVGGHLSGFESLDDALEAQSERPPDGQREGSWMFYSSGTTGVPKGIKPGLPAPELGGPNPFVGLLSGLYGFGADTTYLSPAPLYHAAPAGWTTGTQRLGGSVVVMEHFDPMDLLRLIERHRVTHLQVVPTHLIRLLKLPDADRCRYDLSSLQAVIHAAAPCPVEVKRAAIEWLGPIVHEYYAGSEGTGFCAIGAQEWLDHPGSVGRSLLGAIHILDDDGNELAPGAEGQVWFESTHRFVYHGDPAKTSRAFNDRGWSTIGDIGHRDGDGYLYLTDRASNMIISGGVNIYPREAEDILVMHSAVEDVAIVGTPDDLMGEQVTAYVLLRPVVVADDRLAGELIEYCRERLSHFKCPRSVHFVDSLPRLPSGKLLKRLLPGQ